MELKERKKQLRQETLAKRENFYKQDPQGFQEAARAIQSTLEASFEYQAAQAIMCFVSFKDEVPTHDLIKKALALGKRVFVPYIKQPEKTMIPVEIKDFAEDLEPGYFGILTPKSHCLLAPAPKDLDLIITPGVRFDEKGYRIGYGGGFYDRFFQKLDSRVPRIALAFDLQTSPEDLPKDEFDQPIHALITETGRQDFQRK